MVNSNGNGNGGPSLARIAVIAAVVTAIMAVVAFFFMYHPADFEVTVEPMKLSVEQGGAAIIADVTVIPLHGYDHKVTLTYEELPKGIDIDYTPEFGSAGEMFDSKMRIEVTREAPANEYELSVSARGANGTVRTTIVTLSILEGKPLPTNDYEVFTEDGIPQGDILIWSGKDWNLEPPLISDGDYLGTSPPEGITCFAAQSGSGRRNYIGWGVFLGDFTPDHALRTAHNIDLSLYSSLKFWVKSSVNLKVELQRKSNSGPKSYPCNIGNYGWDSDKPNEWQEVSIPGNAFQTDLTDIHCPFMITGKGDKVTFFVDHVRWVP